MMTDRSNILILSPLKYQVMYDAPVILISF